LRMQRKLSSCNWFPLLVSRYRARIKGNKMVLTVDNESKKIIATVQNGHRIEEYECLIAACENPVCTCGTADLDFIPIQVEDENDVQLSPRKVEIDIVEKSLGYRDKKKVRKQDLEFAQLFLGKLDDNDFQILHERHFAFKNKITEKADSDSIDAYFEYDEVEYHGLMSAYNDVLPYGDQLFVTIDGKECIILDQYCLLPKCSCTDTTLNIMSIDKVGKTGKELCTVSVNYRKKQWKTIEDPPFPVTVKTVRTAIEDQLPNIYNRLLKRHIKLKVIYGYCKKRHYSSRQELQLPKVGRNDPCPCGSGKKYKKCCLRKSS